MKMFRSNGTNAVEKKISYFSEYNHEFKKGTCVEEHIFTKDNICIIFWEELREHEMNLKIVKLGKVVIDVAFRNCYLSDNALIGIEELQRELSLIDDYQKPSRDVAAVDIYLDFLKKNKFI